MEKPPEEELHWIVKLSLWTSILAIVFIVVFFIYVFNSGIVKFNPTPVGQWEGIW